MYSERSIKEKAAAIYRDGDSWVADLSTQYITRDGFKSVTAGNHYLLTKAIRDAMSIREWEAKYYEFCS